MALQHFLSLILLPIVQMIRKPTPARLEPKVPFRKKYEIELLLLKGVVFMIAMFIFAFLVVGQMDPYTNGGLV